MSRLSMLVPAFVLLAISAVPAIRAEEAKTKIQDIMDKYHKGADSLAKTVIAGKADEAKLKELVTAYLAMADEKPPQGDADLWKKKSMALVDATKSVIDKKPEGIEAYKTAVDCKACHTVFKPKK